VLSLLCTTLCIALAQAAQAPASQPVDQVADQFKPDPASLNALERYLSLIDRLDAKLPELASAVEFDPREFMLVERLWTPITVEDVLQSLITNEAWIDELKSVAAMDNFELIVPRFVLSLPENEQHESFVESIMRKHSHDFVRILRAHAAYQISTGNVDEAADSLLAILDVASDFAGVEDGLGLWEMRSQVQFELALSLIDSLLNDTIASIRLSREGRARLTAAIGCLDEQDPAGVFRHWKKESCRLLEFVECELAGGSVGKPLLDHLAWIHGLVAAFSRAPMERSVLGLPFEDGLSSTIAEIAASDKQRGREKVFAFMRSEPRFSKASLLAATAEASVARDRIESIWLEKNSSTEIDAICREPDPTGTRSLVLFHSQTRWNVWRRSQRTFEKVRSVLGMTSGELVH
jgi:hypothetical protein